MIALRKINKIMMPLNLKHFKNCTLVQNADKINKGTINIQFANWDEKLELWNCGETSLVPIWWLNAFMVLRILLRINCPFLFPASLCLYTLFVCAATFL